jgi:hypothetical protein
MSMDEAGSGIPLETPEAKKKNTRSRSAKVRKHLVTSAYRQDIAAKLDTLYAAGHTILAIVPSGDVRGFEVISYSEE